MPKKILHIIVWLVALSVLNSSIQTPDISGIDFGNYTDKQLSGWNEFETVYEWVAEELLCFKNAVPETYQAQHNEDILVKKYVTAFVPMHFEKNTIEHICSIGFSPMNANGAVLKPRAGFKTLFDTPP